MLTNLAVSPRGTVHIAETALRNKGQMLELVPLNAELRVDRAGAVFSGACTSEDGHVSEGGFLTPWHSWRRSTLFLPCLQVFITTGPPTALIPADLLPKRHGHANAKMNNDRQPTLQSSTNA
jgi:hypothetical protein